MVLSCQNLALNKQFEYFSLQDFQLEKRLDNELIEAAAPVLQGVKSRVNIDMKISNEDRAFASTLSYHISMYVSNCIHKHIYMCLPYFYLFHI
jgi:hypothetical protein